MSGQNIRVSIKEWVSWISIILQDVEPEHGHTHPGFIDFTKQVHRLQKLIGNVWTLISVDLLSCCFVFFFCVSGFMANVQRNQVGSQFAPPQSGPSLSPHPSPGGPLYTGMTSYSQSSPAGPYGGQGSQYGHQGWSLCPEAGLNTNIITHTGCCHRSQVHLYLVL